MSGLSWLDRVLIVVLSTLALLVPFGRAEAGVVEQPDRTVNRVAVRYVEPVPTVAHPWRVYFETNDGGTYRYFNSLLCISADDVPDRICRTVFWYAR